MGLGVFARAEWAKAPVMKGDHFCWGEVSAFNEPRRMTVRHED